VIPNEIKYLLNNYEAENISIQISSTDFSEKTKKVIFTIHYGSNEPVPQKWQVEIIDHVASEIAFGHGAIWNSSIELTYDHPLLWQFNDLQGDLYFTGKCENVGRLMSDMNSVSSNYYGEKLGILNNTYNLWAGEYGLVAKGPHKLLNEYAECLNRHYLDTSIVGDYRGTCWNGNEQVAGTELKIFIAEQSYIIGSDFIFTKMEDSDEKEPGE
jgi:hypothetical protein